MRLTKPSREAYRLGPLLIAAQRLSIDHDNQSIAAPPLVVETLVALCRHAGAFISKEELAAELWPQGYGDDATLWQKMYLTRKLLEPYCGKGAIETLPRRGYRLTIPVEAGQREQPVYRFPAAAPITAAMLVIAAAFVLALPLRTTPTALASPAAQRAYNLGMYFERAGTVDGSEKAIAQFHRAIVLAPSSAAAYAGLAQALTSLSGASNRKRGDFLNQASRYAGKALELDPRSAAAETVLAEIAVLRSSEDEAAVTPTATDAARALARSAIALDGSYAPAHLVLGEADFLGGDRSQARRELERAVDLDPSLAIANVVLAQVTYDAGDYASAATYATRAIVFGTSDQEDALLTLGLADVAQHRAASALAVFQKLIGYSRGLGFASRAYVEARIGERTRAQRDLQIATRDGSCNCAKFWLNVALTQVALGRMDATTAARIARSKIGYLAVRDDPRLLALQ